MSITQSLEDFLNDEETKELFDRELWKAREHEEIGEERGIKIGEKRGEKRGEERSLNKVAKNLLKMKADIKYITDATGLTEQEVLNLQKTLQ